MWSNVVEETGEPGENHRTWTGDHYPATCLDPDSNPDRRGDKRVRYPLRYPGAICISYLPSSLPTRAVLRCGLSDPALSIKVRTFHAPIRKGITLAFFFVFRPLKGIPADRG